MRPRSIARDLKPAAAVVSAVAHDAYRNWSVPELSFLLVVDNPVVIDVKGTFDQDQLCDAGIRVWRL